jgi:2-polyprenyl-6-methoxyphenol hydroxylase-like FAD-dependent oxidoreductase
MHLTTQTRGTCIIIGASIAGLLTAKVLAPYFEKILIIERDRLPGTPEYRSGTAQARHAHILLRRGLLGLERMFPGYTQNLLDAGAVMTNASRDWYNLFPMGAFPNFESSYEFICASRPLIEHTLRNSLLQQCSNISIRHRCTVSSITLSPGQPAQITFQPDDGIADHESITAELLVDASGRNSRTPEWLQQQGFGAVLETQVKPWLGYATRLYSNVSMPAGVKATVVMAKDPEMTRGGVLFPIENNQYICTLYGFSRDYPATDETGFMHYASSLRSDIIYNAIKHAQPLTDAKAFIKNESSYRHYAEQNNWAQGFLVIGDAVCSFNPIYGQGMTASVLAAEALSKSFKHGIPASAVKTAQLQRKIVRAYRDAWTISTNEDLRWPKTEGTKSGMLLRGMHRFTDWIGLAASTDRQIAYTYIQVLHMTATPLALLAPAMLLRLLISGFQFSIRKKKRENE